MLLQISVLIVAIAFAVLVVYLVQTLKSLRASLEETTAAMRQVNMEVKEIGGDVRSVIQHTNELAIDVKSKLSTLNHWFGSANDIGRVVHSLTSSMKQMAVASEPPASAAKPNAVLSGLGIAWDVWRTIRARRKSFAESKCKKPMS
ncbi:DUF948 domain-containing protein [Paenibacillus whitsoniae]|uniref:DUF948 domain-containing protein n=1 Tax=Paenibacillus whitsoniae TaxID=2496558 RepID=A0A430JI76_9BACL|nr:DUF948 domain-containing protein [Paenibacillus whitsoniae]RTE10686.1 DUF948 domain-containing protein [Paenibacillus whitsoniae]